MAYNGSQALTGKGTALYIGPSTPVTATFASGATTITAVPAGLAAVSIVPGSLITGAGIPANTTVLTAAGTSLTISNTTTAAGTAFIYQTILGEVRGLTQSGAEAAEEDVTNLQSVAKEIITTINDEGTFDFTCNRVPGDAGQILLQNGFVNQTRFSMTVKLPLSPTQTVIGDQYTGTCYTKSRGFAFEPTKASQFTAKLRITGALTFVAGS